MENYPKINGLYQHYKGGIYKVLFLSKHTETGEVLVNYKSLLFGSYHSRPLENWNEAIKDDDNNLRFKLLIEPDFHEPLV